MWCKGDWRKRKRMNQEERNLLHSNVSFKTQVELHRQLYPVHFFVVLGALFGQFWREIGVKVFGRFSLNVHHYFISCQKLGSLGLRLGTVVSVQNQ